MIYKPLWLQRRGFGATMAPSEAVSKALEKAAKRAAQAAADDTLGLTSETPDSAKNHGIEKKLQEAKDKSRPFSMDIYIGGFYYCHRMYSLHLKHPTKNKLWSKYQPPDILWFVALYDCPPPCHAFGPAGCVLKIPHTLTGWNKTCVR